MADKDDQIAKAKADLEAAKRKYDKADDETQAGMRSRARATGEAQGEADRNPN